MIGELPLYLTVVFVLITLLAIGFLLYAVRAVRSAGLPSNLLVFLLPFWMLVTAFLAMSGFYRQFDVQPPRVFSFGVLPALALVLIYFSFFRKSFIEQLSLKSLTVLHIVRVPVEIVLLGLFQYGLIPQVMTFEGRYFDILSGLTAPLALWLGF